MIRGGLARWLHSPRESKDDLEGLSQSIGQLGGRLTHQLNGTEAAVKAEVLRSALAASHQVTGELANDINRMENAVVGALQHQAAVLARLETALSLMLHGLTALEARMARRLDCAMQGLAQTGDGEATQPQAAAGTGLANALTSIEEGVVKALEQQAARLDAMQQALATLPEGLSAMEVRIVRRLQGSTPIGNGDAPSLEATFVDNLAARLAVVEQASARLPNEIAATESRLNTQLGIGANQLNAAQNYILTAIAEQAGRVEALGARFDGLDKLRELDARLSALNARGVAALIARAAQHEIYPRIATPTDVPNLETQIAQFRAAAPLNVEAWEQAFRRGAEANLVTFEGNLSHDGHLGANYFRMFVNIHARGRILDIGCGPLAMPEYLRDWPVEQIAGVDPLAPFAPHPFKFVQTFAETLPWPDASFETVIIGTSLDHVYLLDRALAEIKRVLVPGGRLLVWTGLLEATEPYDPYAGVVTQPDPYHLFHPGRNWFLKLFQDDYVLIERMDSVASAELIAFERKIG